MRKLRSLQRAVACVLTVAANEAYIFPYFTQGRRGNLLVDLVNVETIDAADVRTQAFLEIHGVVRGASIEGTPQEIPLEAMYSLLHATDRRVAIGRCKQDAAGEEAEPGLRRHSGGGGCHGQER